MTSRPKTSRETPLTLLTKRCINLVLLCVVSGIDILHWFCCLMVTFILHFIIHRIHSRFPIDAVVAIMDIVNTEVDVAMTPKINISILLLLLVVVIVANTTIGPSQ